MKDRYRILAIVKFSTFLKAKESGAFDNNKIDEIVENALTEYAERFGNGNRKQF